MLKCLADAIADGDHVHAVIKGSAINNDGTHRIGFTAPGVDSQAAVITTALANADVEPATVGYVEAHGTATALGDPDSRARRPRLAGQGWARREAMTHSKAGTDVGKGSQRLRVPRSSQ
ncbi:MAG: hypothetical protein LH603_15210 [Pseudonocardia sp.]|nr:hypothetical protein [Pseudonocardia sp.]